MSEILVTSDWHLDAVTAGVDRYPELEGAVNHTVTTAITRGVALYLFLGDLTDPDDVRSHRAVSLAVWAALQLEKEGVPSVWLTGNHDVIEDAAAGHTLAAIGSLGGTVFLADRPAMFRDVNGVSVLALPFTPRHLPYDPAHSVKDLLPLASGPVIVAGHLNIEGIGPGSETTQMARGRDVFLPLGEIDKRRGMIRHVVNGHYHRGQTFRGVHIPGALARLRADERDHRPGFLLLEV